MQPTKLMPVIALPHRATINESSQLITACAKAEEIAEAVTLDASSTTMFGPFGVAIVAATIAMRQRAGYPTKLEPPHAHDAREFLQEVALDRFSQGLSARPGTLEMRQMHALDATYTQKVADLLVQFVPGMNDENAYPIQLCLNELLQNVFEWAESPVGCCSVRLAVVDRGIGIPAVLRRAQVRELHRRNDAEVIVAAVTEPGLTSRLNKVGGLGLKTIRDTVCGRGGRLTVVSLGAKVVWSGERLSTLKSAPLRGTAIEIDIRPNAPFSPPSSHDVF